MEENHARNIFFLRPSLLNRSNAQRALIAAGVGRVATIDIPGNQFDNFDIGYVDSAASRYYVADRSNAAIDIFDTQKNIFVGRRHRFVGVKMVNGPPSEQYERPNGLAFDPGKHQLWSAMVTARSKSSTLRQSGKDHRYHQHGGQRRADELTVDTKDGWC